MSKIAGKINLIVIYIKLNTKTGGTCENHLNFTNINKWVWLMIRKK